MDKVSYCDLRPQIFYNKMAGIEGVKPWSMVLKGQALCVEEMVIKKCNPVTSPFYYSMTLSWNITYICELEDCQKFLLGS